MGRPLKIAKAQAVITLTATNGTTEVVTTSASLGTLGIIAGMPFVPASNIGGLVSGTTYWILKVLSDTTFTVSATPLNANPTSTPRSMVNASPLSVSDARPTSIPRSIVTANPLSVSLANPTGSVCGTMAGSKMIVLAAHPSLTVDENAPGFCACPV